MAETDRFSAFICHASQDADVAQELCELLEDRGLRAWIAPRNVRAGVEYAPEILRGIERSRCLVLLLSTNANDSSMVKREVERAVSKGKPVFPIRIEDVFPSPSLEFFVSATHWVDAWTGRLTDHIDKIVSDLDGREFSSSAAIAKPKRKGKKASNTLWWGLGILLLVVLLRFSDSGPDDEIPAIEYDGIAAISEAFIGVEPNQVDQEQVTLFAQPERRGKPQGTWTIFIRGKGQVHMGLSMGDMRYNFDDQPPTISGDSTEINDLTYEELKRADTITILYLLPYGGEIGPFTYPVDESMGFSSDHASNEPQQSIGGTNKSTRASDPYARFALSGQQLAQASKAMSPSGEPNRMFEIWYANLDDSTVLSESGCTTKPSRAERLDCKNEYCQTFLHDRSNASQGPECEKFVLLLRTLEDGQSVLLGE